MQDRHELVDQIHRNPNSENENGNKVLLVSGLRGSGLAHLVEHVTAEHPDIEIATDEPRSSREYIVPKFTPVYCQRSWYNLDPEIEVNRKKFRKDQARLNKKNGYGKRITKKDRVQD